MVMPFFKVSFNLKFRFIGLQNFITLLNDGDFYNTFTPAAIFVGGSVAGQTGFGFLLAVLLNKKLKGFEAFRMLFLITWLLSDLIIGYMFILLFGYHGTLNKILSSLGIGGVEWLTSPDLAIWIVTLANIWKSASFVMLLHSAGLKSIPTELYEAGRVDGATSWHTFRFITIPLMMPFIALTLIITTMATVNYIGLIYVMTAGGPLNSTTVPAFYMFLWAVRWGRLGYGSTIGLFIVLINLILTGIYLKFLMWKGLER
jgi:ABC-type sugar transport system permease subunit